MTPSEAFEARLARSDRSTLVGKLLISSTVTNSASALLIVGPGLATLGSRAGAMASIFSRYKVNFIRIKFLATSTTAGNTTAIGFLDDASGAEGDGPGSAQLISELRCSAVSFPNQTVPIEFSFTPASRNWYFTFAGASGSDPRLVNVAVLFGASLLSAGSTVNMEIDYSVTFKGAVDVGSS